VLACSIAASVSSCSIAKGSTPSVTSAKTGKTYALLDDHAWTLKRAIDPPANSPFATLEHPPLDWYDEYERTVEHGSRTEGQAVRLSGHATSLARTETLLKAQGFELHTVAVKGWRAIRVTVPGETTEALLVLDHSDSVLMVLSYELTIDDLARVAAKIKLVDRSEWIRAGGVVQ
jgi:hypothetical protein